MRKLLALAVVAGLLMVAACDTEDTTAPTVSIVVPVNGDTLAPGTVTIKAVANDNEGVTKVEFHVGATKIGEDATSTADTFDVSWTAAEGAYTLKAVAWDAADNSKESSISVTIQTGGSGTGPTHHSQNIVGGDSVWYPSGNPHIVDNTINIRENGKLTVKPGCIVKFEQDAAFVVGQSSAGELVAVGTADSIITFTSNNATPNAGDWKGFDFYGQTRSTTHLSYCDINYACWPSYGAINFEDVQSIGIDHTTIHNSSKYGIWFSEDGGYISGFTGNTIKDCAEYPIWIHAGKLSMLSGGNTITGTGNYNKIYVNGGNVTENGTWVNQGVPYFLASRVMVGSSGGARLTIAKGTTVQLGNDVNLTIGSSVPGGLIADSVTFTSSASSPQKGDWTGIWFYPECTDAECQLTNCDIGYGGSDGYGNIWLENAVPTITGCSIHDSKSWGIYEDGTEYPVPDSLLGHNTFANNDSGDVYHP
jgi:hypothetical protein